MIWYAWLKPQVTGVAPAGEIDPFAPAVDMIVEGAFSAKLAVIVWLPRGW